MIWEALGTLWGRTWDHVWVTLGSFLGDFGGSLGSIWVSVGEFVSLDGHFAMIVDSLWVY